MRTRRLMHASFLGSHGFSPSESRRAGVLSAGPLSDGSLSEALG